MNQLEFLVITCNLLKAWEKSSIRIAILLIFVLHLVCWRDLWANHKHSNQNHVIITFYSHLKTVLPATTYNATSSFPVDSINVIMMTQECFEICYGSVAGKSLK